MVQVLPQEYLTIYVNVKYFSLNEITDEQHKIRNLNITELHLNFMAKKLKNRKHKSLHVIKLTSS